MIDIYVRLLTAIDALNSANSVVAVNARNYPLHIDKRLADLESSASGLLHDIENLIFRCDP